MRNIETSLAPPAIGPYSQAIKIGDMLFTSGQIALDQQGNMVAGGIREQTGQVLANLKAIITAAGFSMDHIVKTTVFLADISHFSEMNEVYGEHIRHRPARSTVQAARLPRDALVEIEAIVKNG